MKKNAVTKAGPTASSKQRAATKTAGRKVTPATAAKFRNTVKYLNLQFSEVAESYKNTKMHLDDTIESAKNDLDSMSEMGEMESLRLQMALDRLSKMMSTLSNILKKISDTANSITHNIK